ncbi:hypothetical protein SVI_1085 [Shewanella violacea DSS12]|uniref:Uncharacterized protein n=1 Tax=Shewanella violacea (strain JCM 10179 / CIP 106290 / LMG 19151 / DSS12) TaxID=637905 RepID=D4ZHA7_SHEVD|nr:hypothetical protein SVI_1085 [Shewanella violacea DSS12]
MESLDFYSGFSALWLSLFLSRFYMGNSLGITNA